MVIYAVATIPLIKKLQNNGTQILGMMLHQSERFLKFYIEIGGTTYSHLGLNIWLLSKCQKVMASCQRQIPVPQATKAIKGSGI